MISNDRVRPKSSFLVEATIDRNQHMFGLWYSQPIMASRKTRIWRVRAIYEQKRPIPIVKGTMFATKVDLMKVCRALVKKPAG